MTKEFPADDRSSRIPRHPERGNPCFANGSGLHRARPMRRRLLPAAALLWLAACAGSRVAPHQVAAELAWDSDCYDDIAHVGAELTGEVSTDCGLLRNQASKAARSRFRHCVAAVAASGEPFRLGRASLLPDASRCTVALRGDDGQLWEVHYDFEYDYSAPSDGDSVAFRWILQLSRCESMHLASASAGYFQLEGCIEDEAMADRMLAAREQRKRDD